MQRVARAASLYGCAARSFTCDSEEHSTGSSFKERWYRVGIDDTIDSEHPYEREIDAIECLKSVLEEQLESVKDAMVSP